ncbi:glycoside hydrolase family 43 protein [Streptococcus marmotae]|uniref:glycoside hydrolase family 43 protein n=1 Tax=Streptococcus marmotae TaxID=1825069 RepID=UPI00082C5B3A|nr:glycoside hydrolase family 43 protein [Streptococcus marmotae]
MTVHYKNPIVTGMHPDPSIVLVEGSYYLVNSTFEYYPGISLSRSTDLVNWEKMDSILTKHSQANLRKAKSNEGIFAVCIRYHKGHFYIVTTNFAEWKNFIIRGKLSPDKEQIIWEEKRIEIDIMGIDPDLYFEDQRTYVQFTGYIDDEGTKAIQQVEIDLISGKILRGPEVLSFGTGGRDVEGPHIIKKENHYYLLAAEGGTGIGHMITMFRSPHLWGPYESAPQNPLFTNRDRANQLLQNIGHADLFQDKSGNWWLTCLGTRPTSLDFIQFTNTGRETLLYPVNWDTEWPQIYHGIPTVEVDLTDFPHHAKEIGQQTEKILEDSFISSHLHPEWISLRDSLRERLTVGDGLLCLSGSTSTLTDLATPSFLGLRQTDQEETFQIKLDIEHTSIKDGAIGIATLINSDHYACLLIRKNEIAGYDFIKQIRILDIEVTEKLGTLPYLPQMLSIEHGKKEKIFRAISNKKENIVFSCHSLHFSNEAIAALNTGNISGIYVLDDACLAITQAKRFSSHTLC